MDITIWVVKKDLAKFCLMANYAAEAAVDFGNSCTITGNQKIQMSKANEVTYYETLDEQIKAPHVFDSMDNIKVRELNTVQITLSLYDYLSLETVKTTSKN